LEFRRLRISGKTPAAFFPAERPLFYYVTDRRQLSDSSLLDCIKLAIHWGVDFVQIREKDLSDRALLELTQAALVLAKGTRCRILVNGRADVARAAGAHGVHLPSTDPGIKDLHPSLTRGMIIGISAHSQGDVRRAEAQGAHYVLVGPIYPTESKLRYGSPMGLQRLQRICKANIVAVLGLGGIRPETIQPVLATGAAGVAGISLFQKEISRLAARRHFCGIG
jgi:thiamine-phosphate pyrophosphorylase